MVTIRYVREQQEAAARLARLGEARRIANAMGVQRARMYAERKAAQAQSVENDLEKMWLCEVQQQAALIDRILYEGQTRRGEGMQRAAEVEALQLQHANAELAAWSAEHALEAERHRLARATAGVTRALQQEPQRSIRERKKAVRALEDKRSHAIIAQPRPKQPVFLASSPLAGALSHAALMHAPSLPSSPSPVVDVVVDSTGVPHNAVQGEAAAVQYSEERRKALESALATVEKGHRGAEERAAALLQKKEKAAKQAREVAKQRSERMEALQQRAAAEPVSDELSVRHQEQRRAVLLKAEEEEEFEALFLCGPVAFAKRAAASATEKKEEGADIMKLFPLETVSSLLPAPDDCVVQLALKPMRVRHLDDEPCSNACGGAAATAAEDYEGDDAHGEEGRDAVSAAALVPPSVDALPMPRPALSQPRATLLASEEVPPSFPPPATCSSARGTALPGLEQHHEQFLRNLKALQEKLTLAARGVDLDDTTESSACHPNVTVSSMSSVTTPPRRHGCGTTKRNKKNAVVVQEVENIDEEETGTSTVNTSGSSSSRTSLSSTYTRPYPAMTAEQLKAALLRMKLRMQCPA